MKLMATRGGAMGVSSFLSSPSYFSRKATATSSLTMIASKSVIPRRSITCSAVQESSTSTSTVAANTKPVEKVEEKAAAATKPKAAKKAPTKPLAQMMEEDVIPSLKTILQTEQDISDLHLSFNDNRLEGSFKKQNNPYFFWAFFPNGDLTGPKGFSISSYGTEASTVEPFLVDEKKITAKYVVFWVEKRLAAQGIIPVWKE